MMRSGSGSIKTTLWRALLLAIGGCALLLSLAHARTNDGLRKADGGGALLELKLGSYESRVCPRASLTLMLEATNTGQQPVKIYRRDLWNDFSYSKVGSPMGGSSIACGGDDGGAENWITIEPGAKFYDTLSYPLEYNTFFQEAGSYKLSTSLQVYAGDKYGQRVHSTEAEFEIFDCAAK